jgi:hypothetical protein
LKDLNEKKLNQTSWDDSSLKSNLKLFKESPLSPFARSQTVKCRPSKSSQRPKILLKEQFSPDSNNTSNNDTNDEDVYAFIFLFKLLKNIKLYSIT